MKCDRNCHECGLSKLEDTTDIVTSEMKFDVMYYNPETMEMEPPIILKPNYTCNDSDKEDNTKVAPCSGISCSRCKNSTKVILDFHYDRMNMVAKQRRALYGCKCYFEVLHCKNDPANVFRTGGCSCEYAEDSGVDKMDCHKVPFNKEAELALNFHMFDTRNM